MCPRCKDFTCPGCTVSFKCVGCGESIDGAHADDRGRCLACRDRAAAESAAAITEAVRVALKGEREEIGEQLQKLGDEFADDANEAGDGVTRATLYAKASAYHAAAGIVRARGKVVLS